MSKSYESIPEAGAVIVDGTFLFTEEAPKRSVDKEKLDGADEGIAIWGDQNDLPNLLQEALKKNSDLGSYLETKANILFGEGVGYKIIDRKTGEEVEVQFDSEIEDFLRRNWNFPIAATADYFKYANVFPQINFDSKAEKAYWLINRAAPHCRYGVQNKSGQIEQCYISANWPEKENRLKVKVIDPLLTTAEDLKKELKKSSGKKERIYPISYPTGETYYQVANWHALRENEWLELANKIPKFKLALMKNQLTIKYHIQFPDYYWSWKFPSWTELSNEEKKKKKEEEISNISTFLKGEEKAGKSLITGYKYDEHNNREFPGIKIEAIDDKIKDGIYLEDSVEATIKILSAVGLDPSLPGVIPGKGGSNRSGSDKREALNIAMSLMTPHAKLILQVYEFVSDYNGWNTDDRLIRWRFKSPLLQTLDDVTPKERETIPNDDEQSKD